jgi:DNA repair photolyase
MKIDTDTLCEQHASWIAINPIVGCPKNCQYCFLKPEKLTKITPKQFWFPEEAINGLCASKYYTSDIPVAIGTRTDMFATPANIQYTREFIELWKERNLSNTLIFISKCDIPDEIIDLFRGMQDNGQKVLVFLSYSGLDNKIEVGINHNNLRKSFIQLHQNEIPIIHYWRPFVPQNSSWEIMKSVFDFSTKYASATIVAGLRMTQEMVSQFGFWGNLQNMDIDFIKTEQIFPELAYVNIEKLKTLSDHIQYPLTLATSCAISNALHIPEYNGVYGSKICTNTACPINQRSICKDYHLRKNIQKDAIDSALIRLGIKDIKFSISPSVNGQSIHLMSRIDHDKLLNLTQSIKTTITCESVEENNYGWGSHHYRETLVVKGLEYD